MMGSKSAFDWPSPCSPEIDPPSATTRAAAFPHELLVTGDAGFCLQPKFDARVNTAFTKMSKEQ
jgi:hypothetical protein